LITYLIETRRDPLARRAAGRHPFRMFLVTEADADAIRAIFNQEGELSAAIELRRRFPGITDNAKARAPELSSLAHAVPTKQLPPLIPTGPLVGYPRRPRINRRTHLDIDDVRSLVNTQIGVPRSDLHISVGERLSCRGVHRPRTIRYIEVVDASTVELIAQVGSILLFIAS
jgi:hypothetical protein